MKLKSILKADILNWRTLAKDSKMKLFNYSDLFNMIGNFI